MRQTETKMERIEKIMMGGKMAGAGGWEEASGGGESERRAAKGKGSDDETTTYQVGRYLLDINQLRVLHYPWIQLVRKKWASRGNYLAI